MKRVPPALLALALAACASTSPPKAPPTDETTTTAAALPTTHDDPKEEGDPLAVGGALEAASVPKIERTPAKELRPKTRADLAAAMAIVDASSTVDGAVKRVTARLGKPTWIENGKRRVWIAKDGKGCHRFVLDADGQADLETASASDWRMLAATAQQNACTGEIRRGVQ